MVMVEIKGMFCVRPFSNGGKAIMNMTTKARMKMRVHKMMTRGGRLEGMKNSVLEWP
jgi:hypothetical protein